MTGSVTPVRIFISSPGDLMAEREVVKAVAEELNRSPRYRDRYKLDAYAYEDSSPALTGPEPQVVVDNYLLRPEAADIFVCLLWSRMGTPTRELIDPETGQPYQSGTEYEFLSAYRAYRQHGRPLILLYRGKGSIDPDRLDTVQFERVKGFFERFGSSGDLRGMVGTFHDQAELRETLRRDLEQLLERAIPELVGLAPAGEAKRQPVFFIPTSLPTGYVERVDALAALRQALLGGHATVGVVTAAALHGQGGLGKTVLARAICDDPAVRGAFPDGVLWATLGQRAEPARHQRDWIRALGGDVAAASSLESGLVELSQLLADRAMLLVLDDVWSAGDARWLQAGGTRCATLITTRDTTQAEGAALVPLELMRRQESRELLRVASGGKIVDDMQADVIAERLGDLPLALKVVGALLARGVTWQDIEEALDEGDLQFLDHGQSSVLAAIAAGVNALPVGQTARYHELVVFPHDEPLVETAVVRLWAQTAGLKARQARKLLAEFRDRSLVQADDTLHDLQYDYLRAVVPPEDRRRLHGALADAYGEAVALPDDDERYGWWRLAYHLAQAGRDRELRALLTDGAYLQGKIAALGTAVLLADFTLMEGDETLGRMAGAVRLGAHILDRAPRELTNQLLGRLGRLPELHNEPVDAQPHFRLESQTLTPPGGPLLHTFEGHTEVVTGCAFSPDGRLILSASADSTLRLWEIESGQSLCVLEGHTSGVQGCAFSPDGRLALSASDDRTLRIWEVAARQCVRVLEGHTAEVNACVFSPDGTLALSASGDHTLQVWDVASGRSLRVLEGHTDVVQNCAFSPDGRLALSASRDRTLRVWEVANGRTTHMLEAHTDSVNDCEFSLDGRLALSASEDGTLRVWDVASGQVMEILEGHTSAVRSCAFSPDGRLVLSISRGGTLRVWQMASGQILRILEDHVDEVRGCAFSPDGRFALGASDGGTLRLWEVIGDGNVLALKRHTDGIKDCAFSLDGQLMLSASADGTLQVWEVASHVILHVLEGHSNKVRGCVFSRDGRLALSASADGTLQVWEVASGQAVRVLKGHTSGLTACGFSPDGRLALSASYDGTLRVWDVASGQTIRILKGHADGVRGCVFSPNGWFVLSASVDGTLRLWELASGKAVQVLKGHSARVNSCVFSPDGQLALSASRDHTLRVWDMTSGQTVRVLEGHMNWVRGCAFSPDGSLALSASADRTLRLWEIESGAEVARWHADASLECCVFHPDGRRVIAGDKFGNLHWLRVENI